MKVNYFNEKNKNLTMLYAKAYNKSLQEARSIKKQMEYQCRRNRVFPLCSIIMAVVPFVFAALIWMLFNYCL